MELKGFFSKKTNQKPPQSTAPVRQVPEAPPGLHAAPAPASVEPVVASVEPVFSVSEVEIVYGQAVAAANQALADQITAGHQPDLPPEHRDWFLQHAGQYANPTDALGLTWYAHQDGGKMQLVQHAMLEMTGMDDPANHPGIAALLEQKQTAGSPEASARKDQSEALLRDRDVPINERLPLIEDSSQIELRSTHEVAQRAMCLMAVAIKAEVFNGGGVVEFHPTLLQIIESHDIAGALSPKELAFVHDMAPDRQTAVQFIWRYEGLSTLLWALGFVDTLDYPSAICDVSRAVSTIRDLGPEGFHAAAELRPTNQLIDAADFIYRMHWAVRNAQLGQSPQVVDVDGGVVMERHHTLNWLIGSNGQDWDTVSTDT